MLIRGMLIRERRRGYTLIELMIVVSILAVLTTIAVPSFVSYIYRVRTSEAVTFLAEIRMRQEAYRAEHGQYCAVSGAAWGDWTPAALPGSDTVAWPGGANWQALGARPDSAGVRFQYASIAGAPGTTPPGGLGYTGNDFWSVSQAVGDLDGDGATITFEGYSDASQIWMSVGAGWE